ncbi:sensor domain-containing diguanylate cyclase [Roseovarius aestuarii]|uniref:diguanylate cyclase n=1 Tax=Roseovarius aestuarii TaxID=475083 RepID=A0A1X7BX46_9RHOB|nr:diguanylate cyclase [Roseovarius aestuarii]SMC14075.1 Response regulator PleD [Roseovarius aestuarii]
MLVSLQNFKTKNGVSSIVLFAVIIVAMFGLIRLSPTIIVDKMLARDIQLQASLWENRVINRVSAGKQAFITQQLSAQDSEYLRSITLSSDIYRFSMFTPDGRVFWSSNESEIGRVVSGSFFSEIVATGNDYYMHETVRASEIDDFNLHAISGESSGLREVAEIFTPIIQNGVTLGAIEFFTDITDVRNTFIFRVQVALVAICAIVLALIGVIAFMIRRSGNLSVKRLQMQSEKERELMDQRLQMAREVRLLGELNEWLQSSSSLDELFEMVSEFMTHILPNYEGSVYVYSNSRDVLDGCVSWNGGSHKEHIVPKACWGLRKGRTYSYGESEVDFVCEHMKPADKRAYICFPILAHGETVGLMTLRAASNTTKEEFQAGKKLSQMCAEQISMAIANVRMRDQLQDQSVRDPLTGLFNRRHLTESLRQMITRSHKDGTALNLVSVDVDHFKKFNDNHGHDAGDMVLRAVGAAMVQLCDGDELACRLGGEEFMLLLPEVSKEDALARAERLRQVVEDIRVRYGEKNLPRITISIGVSHYPDHGTMPQDLMRAADDALYEAKARGRNQIVVANMGIEAECSSTKQSKEPKNNGRASNLAAE